MEGKKERIDADVELEEEGDDDVDDDDVGGGDKAEDNDDGLEEENGYHDVKSKQLGRSRAFK
ncbi:hypothetical protein FACS189472_15540 [Alphaproteobacteria bacterium]|nr:hypothetical protein FACS189472_15540 [Alphaproteobacteria bacterium]